MRIYYETFHLHRLIPNSVTNTVLVASRKEYQCEESFNSFWLMVISGFYFSIDFVVSLVIDLTCQTALLVQLVLLDKMCTAVICWFLKFLLI